MGPRARAVELGILWANGFNIWLCQVHRHISIKCYNSHHCGLQRLMPRVVHLVKCRMLLQGLERLFAQSSVGMTSRTNLPHITSLIHILWSLQTYSRIRTLKAEPTTGSTSLALRPNQATIGKTDVAYRTLVSLPSVYDYLEALLPRDVYRL